MKFGICRHISLEWITSHEDPHARALKVEAAVQSGGMSLSSLGQADSQRRSSLHFWSRKAKRSELSMNIEDTFKSRYVLNLKDVIVCSAPSLCLLS
jgi:hypothetical protein